MSHEHVWEPLLGLFRRYVCSCGVTGYRRRSGDIVPHANQEVYASKSERTVGTGIPNLPGGNRQLGNKRGAP